MDNIASNIDAGYSAVAYVNSNPNVIAAATEFYYINSATNKLFMASGAFNAPTISLIGAIGLDVLNVNGFELFSNGNAFAAVNLNNGTSDNQLLGINLSTRAGTLLDTFNGTLNGLSAAPSAVLVPAALPLVASALGVFGIARRGNSAKKDA